MSLEATNWVWEHSKASGNDLIVLLRIADNANADGGGAYPGIAYLAKAARASRRTVFDCLRRLKASGELVEEQHGGGRLSSDGNPGRKTIYRVVIDGSANGAEPASYPEGETVQPDVGTVQPDVGNGADSRSAYIRNRTTQEPPKEPRPARPDVDELCELLRDRIVANGGSEARYRNKPATKAWQDPMRRLLDVDGITADRVRKAIEWCQADPFWKGVILSPTNLREKYDQLRLAAQRPNGHNGNGSDRRPPPEIPEADLTSRPPRHDPVAMMAWSDRQLEEATRT